MGNSGKIWNISELWIKGKIMEYLETREQRKYKENEEYWENIQDRVNWENKKGSE